MVEAGENALLLDAEDIKNLHPIPHHRFDILVGKVVLEELSTTEWTDAVTEKVFEQNPDLVESVKPYLASIIDAAEDIYIHELVRPHVWSFYLSKYWQIELLTEKRNSTPLPSPSNLASIWRRKVIVGEQTEHLPYYFQDLLNILISYTTAIKAVISLPSSVKRRDRRVDLYLRMWSEVFQILSQWEENPLNPDATDWFDEARSRIEKFDVRSMGRNEQEERQKDKQETDGLEEDLAAKVSRLMEGKGFDQTQGLAVAMESPAASSMGTVFTRSEIRTNIKPDERIVRHLKRIFKKQKALIRRSKKKYIRRRLPAGKLDARRLYRVPFDEKVFKNKEIPRSDPMWQICIVTDASASMAGRGQSQVPWEIAERTFVSLAAAARGFKNHLDIYAYNEEKKICQLIQLYRGGEIYSVAPAGRTPSGEAIMAAAMRLKKKYQKSIIIHITDGATNCGLPLSEAARYCLDNKIEVFTIGCGCSRQTKDYLRQSFPTSRLYFMKDINLLAEGLEQLFKKKIFNQTYNN